MPSWAYYLKPIQLAILVVGGVLFLSMLGLALFRRLVMPRVTVHDGVNDAISGTVQAVGVFYGVTVGLLSVGVWNTWANSADLATREAAAIGAFYRDVSSFPEPARGQLRQITMTYLDDIIHKDWVAQRAGAIPHGGSVQLDQMESVLNIFEPKTEGQRARYSETLGAYNRLLQQRALRIDAVGGGLSGIMWAVIWFGAAISIGVAYFFHLQDWRLHASLVGLMAGFLGVVIFMIVVNDRPYLGEISVGPDSYELIQKTLVTSDGTSQPRT